MRLGFGTGRPAIVIAALLFLASFTTGLGAVIAVPLATVILILSIVAARAKSPVGAWTMDILTTAIAASILVVAAFDAIVYRNQARTLRMRPVESPRDSEAALRPPVICLQFIDPPPSVLCFRTSGEVARYVRARNGEPVQAEFKIIYRPGRGRIVDAETYELKAIDGRPAGYMPPLQWPAVPPPQFDWW
jgi:hypothetical protein